MTTFSVHTDRRSLHCPRQYTREDHQPIINIITYHLPPIISKRQGASTPRNKGI